MTTTDRNPQVEQMSDESMLRNLAAQAEAIWPQEQTLLDRYRLPADARIADIGCGSGEITARLAGRFPRAAVIGVDILESWVAYSRRRHAALTPRVRFEQGDAFELAREHQDGFDLVVCRHMTQAVPNPALVLAEMKRICRPGGWLHLLSEDYAMLHMPAGSFDPDRLWHEGVIRYGARTGTDARVGRRTWSIMQELGLTEVRVDYVIVDTLRVPRATFAAVIEAWRDGYARAVVEHTALSQTDVFGMFNQAIDSIRDPTQYAVWHVPIVSGRKSPGHPG